jgi:hypothetical protein
MLPKTNVKEILGSVIARNLLWSLRVEFKSKSLLVFLIPSEKQHNRVRHSRYFEEVLNELKRLII